MTQKNQSLSQFSDRPYIVVIGGTVADIQGFSSSDIVLGESNIGKVSFSSGGVARNIAENLARLDLPVILLSAVGADAYGKLVLEATAKCGVNTSLIEQSSSFSTAVYLALFDHHNNLSAAIAGMEIFDIITPDYLNNHFSIINNAEIIVADTNLSVTALEYLAHTFKDKPIFIDPVSLAKTDKIVHLTGFIHTIKPNTNEAEIISGIKITDLDSAEQAGKNIVKQGCRNCFISMAEKGVLAIDKNETVHIAAPKVKISSVSGAGDAYMAGLVYGTYHNYSLQKRAVFANKMAALTLQSSKTISEEINHLRG